jgi:hypothetical protein
MQVKVVPYAVDWTYKKRVMDFFFPGPLHRQLKIGHRIGRVVPLEDFLIAALLFDLPLHSP